MTYEQAVQYLFDSAPMFQNVGAAAYKEGLGGTLALDEHFGHPHRHYRTIHVGGTNGKGSVCHTLAAILQAQGDHVGLYTSPHLVDFRERIRVNGKKISKKRVVDFVKELKMENGKLKGSSILNLQSSIGYSFFELATALAFKFFEEQKVDFAVIEVGLGGRLDCTNIIQPVLSVITNISFDHVQFLGDTLPKIASEKAGIIKSGIPVCIGENVNPEITARLLEKYGYDQPLGTQFVRYTKALLQGDMGESMVVKMGDPVTDVILERFPTSAKLGLIALAIALIFGIPLGVLAATRHGSIFDRIFIFLSSRSC